MQFYTYIVMILHETAELRNRIKYVIWCLLHLRFVIHVPVIVFEFY